MTRLARLLGATLASLVVLAPNEQAVGLSRPENLQVVGGEETWRADNGFRLDWINPTASAEGPIVAATYRIRNAANAIVVPDTRIDWGTTLIENIEVPGAPGAYTAEVWLEDAGHNQGPPAMAKLRFDSTRPGRVDPLPVPAWIDRNSLPYVLRLTHPVDPQPPSGIRGYAVSVHPKPTHLPCAAVDRCTDAETDLHAGVAGDSLALADLPEGVTYVHAVAVSGAGLMSTNVGSAVLHVDTTDPVTTLAGAPKGWGNRPVTLVATATDALSGMRAAGPSGPFTAIQVDGGSPTTAAGGAVGAVVIGEGLHTIAYYARDAAGNHNDGAGGNGMANRPPETATVRIDREAPSAAFVNAQDPEAPETIEVHISDSLSGPDPVRGGIEIRRNGSSDEFEPLPTDPQKGKLIAHWDSDAYPGGEYEFRATGYDVAGNVVRTGRRAGGTAMVLPNPLKVSTELQTGFGGRTLLWHRCTRHGERRRCRREAIEDFGRRPAMRFVPYGRGTLFSGRLSAGPGSPLGQMSVQVIERFGPGGEQAERVTTVRTGDTGIFTVRLAPGPSRQVQAAFSGTRTLTRTAGKPHRLGVRAGVRMRSSATVATVGGRPIVFRGEIAAEGATIPDDGKSIELQFRLPGLPWTEFRTIHTDTAGRFRYAYRFADDDSRGVRFQFRAYAPAQSGWPYEPAASRPVVVRGL